MAEAIQDMFDYQELVELMIKKQGLHEGLWMLSIEFGQAAASVPTGDGKTFMPAAINLVQRIGIKKHEGELAGNLVVDAAVVNPNTRRRDGGRRATKSRVPTKK